MDHRLDTALGELLGRLAGVEERGVVRRDDDRLPALFDAGAQGVVVGDLEADAHGEGDVPALGDGRNRQGAGAGSGKHVDADPVDLGGQATYQGTGGDVLREGHGPVLAVVRMSRLARDVSGIPDENIVVADVADNRNRAHEHRRPDRLSGLIDNARRGRVVARVQVRRVLRPDDHVEAAGAHVGGQLLGRLGVVAGHLQGPVEGVLEVGGHIALDGSDPDGTVLSACLQGQCPRRNEHSRCNCCAGEDRHRAALVDGSSCMGEACGRQCHQQPHPGAADIGRRRQDRGIRHGEGQASEGETAQRPHRAQLLDPGPQHGEEEHTGRAGRHTPREPPSSGGSLQQRETAHQGPGPAECGQVEGLEERQRDPADRVAHAHHREVQQRSEQAEAVEQSQTGARPEAAAADQEHEGPDPDEGRPPQVHRGEGGVGGQPRQQRHHRRG